MRIDTLRKKFVSRTTHSNHGFESQQPVGLRNLEFGLLLADLGQHDAFFEVEVLRGGKKKTLTVEIGQLEAQLELLMRPVASRLIGESAADLVAAAGREPDDGALPSRRRRPVPRSSPAPLRRSSRAASRRR